MSQTHLAIQKSLLQKIPGAVLEKRFSEIGRIADVVWEKKRVVFEVQFSPIHPLEVRERMRDYALVGYRVVWILHENRFNPLRPNTVQDFLQFFPHLYTNIDELMGGDIYQVHSMQRIPVDFNTFDLRKRSLRLYFLGFRTWMRSFWSWSSK